MVKSRDLLKGFLGGAVGGAAVDLIFINLAGPSALFSLLGIGERGAVFGSHLVLGGILGVLFVLILERFPRVNVWLLGVVWGMVCLIVIGAIPSLAISLINLKTTLFGILVWVLYGLILAAAIKISEAYE